ncbi:EVE domain-containing protein [Candidatus Persebacteraceae bacterium Df01]|jgi:predicted RNA-binding protein with PUA-like domain|uniref:EVE domain-containing protein n=1 Tax=Candidatus Doriopsillibacter californiensis TaxID=2970740 RepID=A0ABT7QK48_9GAMM|nr:EVE domain-containing protein [Candidatus Persebacteraceae bacterium Df01]
MHRWLLKSEPGDYAIDDLARDKRDWWTGIRNYQARNFMIHDMHVGDGALFYHSNCAAPGVYGVAKVCAQAATDDTQFAPDSKYYDSKSSPDNPRWRCVQIAFVRKLKKPFLLADMRHIPELEKMLILRRGNRLSITPVSDDEWRLITGDKK